MSRSTPDGPGRTVLFGMPRALDFVGGDVRVVDLTRLEREERRGCVLELAADDAVELGLGAPVVVVAGELHRLAGAVGLLDEGPGADGLAGCPPVVALLHRRGIDRRERRLLDDEQIHDVVRQERVRGDRLDRDRLRVGRLDADEVGRGALRDVLGSDDALHAATGVARPDLRVEAELERELDVSGREVRAVRPLDARMELERPGLLVARDLPRVGELGDERAVLAGERVLGDRGRHHAVGDEVLPDEVQELVVAACSHRAHVVDADATGADEGAREDAAGWSVGQPGIAGHHGRRVTTGARRWLQRSGGARLRRRSGRSTARWSGRRRTRPGSYRAWTHRRRPREWTPLPASVAGPAPSSMGFGSSLPPPLCPRQALREPDDREASIGINAMGL